MLLIQEGVRSVKKRLRLSLLRSLLLVLSIALLAAFSVGWLLWTRVSALLGGACFSLVIAACARYWQRFGFLAFGEFWCFSESTAICAGIGAGPSLPKLTLGTKKPDGVLRCVVISDTHNKHSNLSIPPGGEGLAFHVLISVLTSDVLIHCGDFTMGGSLQVRCAVIAHS